jgi:hypothetical protein
MKPVPCSAGRRMWVVSLERGRRRWRDSSSRPKREILPTWTRARSWLEPSRRRFSTSRWFFALLHVDEVDDDQAAEVAQAQLAGDLVGRLEVGVESPSSRCRAARARAEFTSTETSASVWSITMAPPDGSVTLRR